MISAGHLGEILKVGEAMTTAVAVVGSGYVGTVVAACMASVGHRTIGVEVDEAKLNELAAGRAPFYEPGLERLLSDQVASGRLTFTSNYAEALAEAGVVFLCVGTPSTEDGRSDMAFVEAAAHSIGLVIRPDHVLVTKSTVPIGSGNWLASLVEDAHHEAGGDVGAVRIVSNPEFLREGSAIEDFLYPDRVVLGGSEPAAIDQVAELYRPILEQSFDEGRDDVVPELVVTDLPTAETIKYAANAFLATKISFINEIARMCDAVGASVTDVATAIGLDRRIGPSFLGAGVGWGGSCFRKDLSALSVTARDHGIVPAILDAVIATNDAQVGHVIQKLQRHLGILRGRRIALLGLAFKPGTDDLRDAPSLRLASQLIELGSKVKAFDPIVADVEMSGLATATDAYQLAERADAVVLVTDWPEFVDIDLVKLAAAMRGNLLLDGRNALDPMAVEAAGLIYEGIGRRGLT